MALTRYLLPINCNGMRAKNRQKKHKDRQMEKQYVSRTFRGAGVDLVTYFLIPHDPVLTLSEILSRTSFWASLKLFGLKMWPLKCPQGFSIIWSCDLLFDPTWPSFELDQDIVKMIILSKSDEDWTNTVASIACSQGFSMICPTDLVFDLTWPIFKLDRDIVKVIILSKFDKDWTRTVASSVHKVFLWFDLLT